MKLSSVNVNITFKLLTPADNITQAKLLKDALDQMEAHGIEVNTVRGPSVGSPSTKGEKGPNELRWLEVASRSRMRVPSNVTDREAYAAEMLKKDYGIVLDENESGATVETAPEEDVDVDTSDLV
jgi:hypothetical protein